MYSTLFDSAATNMLPPRCAFTHLVFAERRWGEIFRERKSSKRWKRRGRRIKGQKLHHGICAAERVRGKMGEGRLLQERIVVLHLSER